MEAKWPVTRVGFVKRKRQRVYRWPHATGWMGRFLCKVSSAVGSSTNCRQTILAIFELTRTSS